MPSWSAILKEAQASADVVKYLDIQRHEYLAKIALYTGRNVISYYSGWMQKPNVEGVIIDDKDINALMENV